MALEAEEIQINTNVPPIDKELVKGKGIQVIETPSVTTEMVWFNNEKLTLEERAKISKAINKGDLIATSLEGSGTIATSMIPENSYGFSPNTKKIEVEDVEINRKLKIILNDVGTRKTNAQIIQANLKYEDYAILPLYYPNYSVGIANNIVGFKGDERGLYNFSQLNFKN